LQGGYCSCIGEAAVKTRVIKRIVRVFAAKSWHKRQQTTSDFGYILNFGVLVPILNRKSKINME